jgi:hypothetical protein
LTKYRKLLILALIEMPFCNKMQKYLADVAELADAQASGACALWGVEVRLLSSALNSRFVLWVLGAPVSLRTP